MTNGRRAVLLRDIDCDRRLDPPAGWSVAPARPRLARHQIHLWRAFLDRDGWTLDPGALSGDERARAARFVFERDRKRFAAARGILRDIIGTYLDRPAGTIEFGYGAEGKPMLRRAEADPPLTFNVSHSHGMALYAFAHGREVGVDLEAVRSDAGGDAIAERFFSPREVAALRELPADCRNEGFFRCWTRKEAYVKARGGGLRIPLHGFDVSLAPGEPERLTSADADRWTLRSICPAEGFAGALAGEGQGWALRLWDWRPAQAGVTAVRRA